MLEFGNFLNLRLFFSELRDTLKLGVEYRFWHYKFFVIMRFLEFSLDLVDEKKREEKKIKIE